MAATLLVMLGYSSLAGGCKCPPPPPPLDSLAAADAVFAGVVVGVDVARGFLSSGDLFRYSIRITHTWKGVLTDIVSVDSERYSSACGFPFRQGEQYVIYAYYLAKKDGLGAPILSTIRRTSRCTRTSLLADALADRYKLPPPADFMSPTPLPEVTLAALVKQLEDDDPSERRIAARALAEIGEEMELACSREHGHRAMKVLAHSITARPK